MRAFICSFAVVFNKTFPIAALSHPRSRVPKQTQSRLHAGHHTHVLVTFGFGGIDADITDLHAISENAAAMVGAPSLVRELHFSIPRGKPRRTIGTTGMRNISVWQTPGGGKAKNWLIVEIVRGIQSPGSHWEGCSSPVSPCSF